MSSPPAPPVPPSEKPAGEVSVPGLLVAIVGRDLTAGGAEGPGEVEDHLLREAAEVGAGVAQRGGTIVCGGLGGVMEAACRGAAGAGGITVGILPGKDRSAANRWVSVPLATGLGELRNGLVVRAADVVVAVGGEYGTLSEIAFALKAGTPVVGLGTWSLVRPAGEVDAGIFPARSAAEAVELAFELGAAARRVSQREERAT